MVTYTHSMDTVSCLYSNHPDLETFWSGSRDGWVTKLSRRRIGGDGGKANVDEELVDCVAICQEDGPVTKVCFVFSVPIHMFKY
jgi:WD repeat-containing protein 48